MVLWDSILESYILWKMGIPSHVFITVLSDGCLSDKYDDARRKLIEIRPTHCVTSIFMLSNANQQDVEVFLFFGQTIPQC